MQKFYRKKKKKKKGNEIPVQQAAAAKVTRPFPSLAERGVATRD